MTDPRISIEDIRRELQQTSEDLAEASDNLERLVGELAECPIDHEYWPEQED